MTDDDAWPNTYLHQMQINGRQDITSAVSQSQTELIYSDVMSWEKKKEDL